MATCARCGQWAGVFRDMHDSCEAPAPPTEMDLTLAKLTPLLMRAATRAGFIAAVTFIGISVAGGLFYFLLAQLLSSPSGR